MDNFELIFCWVALGYFLCGTNRTFVFLVSMVIVYLAYYREKVAVGNEDADRPINDALEKYIQCEQERVILTVKVLKNFMKHVFR